jgi:predicted permease
MSSGRRSRRQREEELREEIDAHLRMAIAERVARGESAAEAERAVRREFGNVTLVSEVTREMWGGVWLERLLRDVRYGVRGLRRAPGFAAVAIVTLALGVGANTAVYTVVHSVLVRPLAFERPHELFLLGNQATDAPFMRDPSMDENTFLEYRRENQSFEQIAAFNRTQLTLTGAGEPVRLAGAMVTADFLSVLGVRAALGRTFARDEDLPGRERVVVLGDLLWRERFGASSALIGRAVTLNGVTHTVIGVMPPSFAFPYDAQVWVPMLIQPQPGRSWSRPVVGRLQEGVTVEAAQRELQRIATRDGAEGGPAAARSIRVLPLKSLLTANVEKSLLVFAGAVGFVLLIACANVANLLLIRGAARRHEIVVRAALGASRGRIVRQLLTESALVAMLGGVAGILLSLWGVRALLAMAPAGRIPRVDEIHIDGVVLAVSLGATLLAGLLFGLAPALAVTRQQLRGVLGEGARTLGGGHERLRRSLVVSEIALAIVLLTGAGLLLRSFARMRAIDPGFRPEHVIALSLNLPDADYASAAQLRHFHTQLLDRLAPIPGVEHAAAVNWAPLTGNLIRGDIYGEGGTPERHGWADKLVATPGYFRAMGIRLLYGREFTAQDDERAPGVVVISESVAKAFWPPHGADAIGKRLTGEDRPKPEDWLTIVGVVDDVAQQSLTQERGPAVYTPVRQTPRPFFMSEMTFVLRTRRAPSDVMETIRERVWELDANLPVPALTTMDELVARTIADPKFEARLLTVFSLLALLLAAVGTYGVLAYDVTARHHEIGLRMALGARRGNVVHMVLRRALSVVLPGIVLGVAGALALTRILEGSLYEVKPVDPVTFGAVSALLFAVAVIAALVPTRRATKVDPLIALRHE